MSQHQENDSGTRPFAPLDPLVIGLVGGVAAGKSTVAKLFCEHGIRHIDADQHARAASADPEALAEVRARLGAKYVTADGQLDRPELAKLVFAEPEQKRVLEEILHPRVRQRIDAALQEAHAAGQSSLLDVPLLFEAGLWERCNTIVFVAAADEARQQRARSRGWADDELAKRERNQLPLAEKQSRSDHTIANDGTLAETAASVAELLRTLEMSS
ncbi:MAG: dephospho-CoA kinase [Planctomycetota bacterium]